MGQMAAESACVTYVRVEHLEVGTVIAAGVVGLADEEAALAGLDLHDGLEREGVGRRDGHAGAQGARRVHLAHQETLEEKEEKCW